MLRPLSIVLAASGALACTRVRTVPPSWIEIAVSYAPPTGCHVEVAGSRFILPEEEDRLLAALRPLAPASHRDAIVTPAGLDVPYRCVGHAVYIAQRAGLAHVGFISEPAPRAR